MNIILRFKNPATLTAIVVVVVAFVYEVLGFAGVVPAISEADVLNFAAMVITILVGLGVLVDPTTEGITDSERAMCYIAPGVPKEDAEG